LFPSQSQDLLGLLENFSNQELISLLSGLSQYLLTVFSTQQALKKHGNYVLKTQYSWQKLVRSTSHTREGIKKKKKLLNVFP
jgi:hypothetical protein